MLKIFLRSVIIIMWYDFLITLFKSDSMLIIIIYEENFENLFFLIDLYSTTLSSFFVFDLRNLLLVWLLFYRWAMWAHDPCLKFQLQPYMKFSFNLATFSALYSVRLFALDPDHQCVWELAHFDVTYTCLTSQKFSDTPSFN